MKATSWIVRRPELSAKFRLFCFSYAGGNAMSFMDWQSGMLPGVVICAVQLPGRGARYHETPRSDLQALVAELADVIGGLDDLPCAFFGHSLGALLAFELTRHLERHGLMRPQHLFVSGCHAPRFRTPSELHLLDDDGLIGELEEYQGTPPEVLAHRELMELVLPTIRADFALVGNYKYQDGALLSMPVTVLAGCGDRFDSPLQVDGWKEETSNECRIHWFDGDHFFLRPHQQEVLACINAEVAQLLADHVVECA
jgi:surfactin synthase thioesterase subunit